MSLRAIKHLARMLPKDFGAVKAPQGKISGIDDHVLLLCVDALSPGEDEGVLCTTDESRDYTSMKPDLSFPACDGFNVDKGFDHSVSSGDDFLKNKPSRGSPFEDFTVLVEDLSFKGEQVKNDLWIKDFSS